MYSLVLGVQPHGTRIVCCSMQVGTGQRSAGQSAGVDVLVTVGQGRGRDGSVVTPMVTEGGGEPDPGLGTVLKGTEGGGGSVVTPMETLLGGEAVTRVVMVMVVCDTGVVLKLMGGHRGVVGRGGAGHDEGAWVSTRKLHPPYGHPSSASQAWIRVAVGIVEGHPHGLISVSWCEQRW